MPSEPTIPVPSKPDDCTCPWIDHNGVEHEDQDCPVHGWDDDIYGEDPLGGSWS